MDPSPRSPRFSTEKDAIRLGNAGEYGLASYLYSRDFTCLLRVAEQIELGMVCSNAGVISNAAAPFGGVKQSGLAREGGSEGNTQYIGIAAPTRINLRGLMAAARGTAAAIFCQPARTRPGDGQEL